jgi:hypothetical protein
MRNIITNVEERSNTPNNERSARVIITNTALGAVAGAFTGGIGAAALGAGAGGVVGVARTYRPENENFRASRDGSRWRPSATDGYTTPPSSS